MVRLVVRFVGELVDEPFKSRDGISVGRLIEPAQPPFESLIGLRVQTTAPAGVQMCGDSIAPRTVELTVQKRLQDAPDPHAFHAIPYVAKDGDVHHIPGNPGSTDRIPFP